MVGIHVAPLPGSGGRGYQRTGYAEKCKGGCHRLQESGDSSRAGFRSLLRGLTRSDVILTIMDRLFGLMQARVARGAGYGCDVTAGGWL